MYHATTKDEKRLYRCRSIYATEIARHTSAMISALTRESLTNELDQAIKAFEHWYGRSDLNHFLSLIADRLATRGHPESAQVVLDRARETTTPGTGKEKSPVDKPVSGARASAGTR